MNKPDNQRTSALLRPIFETPERSKTKKELRVQIPVTFVSEVPRLGLRHDVDLLTCTEAPHAR